MASRHGIDASHWVGMVGVLQIVGMNTNKTIVIFGVLCLISLGLGYVYGKWRQGSGRENAGNAKGNEGAATKEPKFLKQPPLGCIGVHTLGPLDGILGGLNDREFLSSCVDLDPLFLTLGHIVIGMNGLHRTRGHTGITVDAGFRVDQ